MPNRTLVLLFLLMGLFVLPVYAYGDPTGGMLFQVLMPILATIWGIWLILANKIRGLMKQLVQDLRGHRPGRPVVDQPHVPNRDKDIST